MKKTFMAMLLMGGSLSLFAQIDTTRPTTNPPTQQSAADTSREPNAPTGNNMNNMNNNAANTMNNGSNINTWNGVSVNSTSWAPERDPSWNWNNYGVWSGSVSTTAPAMNNTTAMNADSTMRSTGSYSAFGGTAVPYLPNNVQMRFNQDFPSTANNSFSWNQYGDWFYSHQLNNGRLIQYFYDPRGNGYSVALPVLHTYVPENIVASALNKYGSNLYSIAMVNTNKDSNVYQLGLLDRGQLYMQYLNESGATVNDVWRVEEVVDSAGMMNATDSNAAKHSSMNQNSDMNHQDANGQPSTNSATDMNQSQATDPSSQVTEMKTKEGKTEIEYADGSQTKIKTDKDKIKIKTKGGKKTKIENE